MPCRARGRRSAIIGADHEAHLLRPQARPAVAPGRTDHADRLVAGKPTAAPVAAVEQARVEAIGAIAINPKDTKNVWVGTGEGNPRNSATIGNAWVDLVRSTLYVLLPLSIILALALVSQGVVQTFSAYPTTPLVESIEYDNPKLDAAGQPIKDDKGNPVTEKATYGKYGSFGFLAAPRRSSATLAPSPDGCGWPGSTKAEGGGSRWSRAPSCGWWTWPRVR